MLNRKISKATLSVFLGSVLLGLLSACGGTGDTDGGQGVTNDASIGTQFVSDGGSGGTLRIEAPATLATGEREEFRVIATDPTGAPLSFIRIFCESELGIAILEPSSGGLAFESTGAAGVMSGVLGGLTAGSYLLECRGPQGFNLLARTSILITGDVPEGFDGFPGAAGGNLGGGLLVEPPFEDSVSAQITFTIPSGDTRNGPIDITFNPDCNGDGTADDPEAYIFNNYNVAVVNGRDDRLFVESIVFTVDDGQGVTSSTQLGGLVINPNSSSVIVGSFTEFVFGTAIKTYAGTTLAVIPGTYNVTFTIRGTTGSGESFSLRQNASVTFASVNNCG
jgi:hypothetical protein